jgi:DNA-binding transcriptional regulator/RsmH inhibitor MraZ
VVVGAGNRLEIWNRDNWESVSEGIDAEELAEKMAQLGIGF